VKVFVTGATGFVGSHLVRELLDRGDEVVCLVRDVERARKLLGEKMPTLVHGSLNDRDKLRSACEGADIIFHSAALTTARSRDEFFAVNTDGTQLLVEVASEAAPELSRLVFVSSQTAAGPSKRGEPRTEEHSPVAVSNYGASKLAGEDRVRKSHLPWTIVRPCAVYGPGDQAFLSVFKIAKLGFIPALGSPDQQLSMVHVSDLVRCLLGVVTSKTLEQTYFASHPEIVTGKTLCKHARSALYPGGARDPLIFGLPRWAAKSILEITYAAASAVGKSTFLSPDKGHEYFAEAWLCSPKKIEQDIGWRAEIGIEEGVRDTVRWYRKNGWL
jgi:nucleoside-diphosphate-sugar epimerase